MLVGVIVEGESTSVVSAWEMIELSVSTSWEVEAPGLDFIGVIGEDSSSSWAVRKEAAIELADTRGLGMEGRAVELEGLDREVGEVAVAAESDKDLWCVDERDCGRSSLGLAAASASSAPASSPSARAALGPTSVIGLSKGGGGSSCDNTKSSLL